MEYVLMVVGWLAQPYLVSRGWFLGITVGHLLGWVALVGCVRGWW